MDIVRASSILVDYADRYVLRNRIHSLFCNPIQTFERKGNTISQLQSMNIPYHPHMSKCEHLEIVRRPSSCDLNHIELMWSMGLGSLCHAWNKGRISCYGS
ncbi:hypothetical protein Trydic_g20568 [Trypoxylus dichotomus]